MKQLYLIFSLIALLILLSCAANKPYTRKGQTADTSKVISRDNIDYELYMVGDIGGVSNDILQTDIVDLIKSELIKNDVEKSVVFLGNSFSKKGVPDTENPNYSKMDIAIEKCIKELKDHTDKVYFIPGNTEWFDGVNYSVNAVQNVEDYVESKVGKKNIFVPSNGCGEPKLVKLTDDLLLLLIDSQWVLQGDRSAERKRSGCEIDNEIQLAVHIEHILAKNKNKNVIISAHHPIYSNGATGGNRGLKSHLLPLPIIGSIISGINKISGGQQKFGHPQYEAYRSTIKLALQNFEGVLHVSAHDKNLQYHNKDNNHFVVAGSGQEVDYTRNGGTADFSYMKRGFAKIIHTKNLELWLEFHTIDSDKTSKTNVAFRKRIYKKEINDYTDKTVYKDQQEYPQSIKTKASELYKKGKIGLGKTYRKEWGTEIESPVLFLDDYAGGLTPIQQGGGFQTKSLRLENPNGQQWVARTIDKDVTKIVPHALRGTFAKNLVQDGISAAHPYGALVIPKLAEAAEIYHANPKLMWIPKQKALGDYNTALGERLYLFEERPGGNLEGHPTYGGAKKSVNTPELIEKLYKNHKHVVDQEYILKARLFDLLIGDWDRHEDQWRWGIYDGEDGNKIYRAIPRDRDQVFFKNDGFLNYLFSRKYFNYALQKFDYEIKHLDGLAYNARHFDRQFLSELNKDEFIKAAKQLQVNISDEVLMSAFKDWPQEIYNISGPEIISKLKKRREDIITYAEEFYYYLTKEVTVTGTYGKNTFEIIALSGNKLDVKAFHHEDDAKHLIWSRIIDGKDCNELRIFGLKKSDTFNFSGSAHSTIKVRLVGGSGNDIVNNNSDHIEVIAYDRTDGMSLKGNRVKSKLKNEKGINRYDRLDWKLNRSFHFPIPTFYTDEGIGLNYNIWWIKNGFRKNPYKSSHQLGVSYFMANSAIVGLYTGHWTSIFGPNWDLRLEASFTGPTFTQFFYGLGNQYNNFEEIFPNEPSAGSTQYHIVRGVHLDINPHFEYDLGNNNTFSINPTVEYMNLDNELNDPDESRFIFSDEANRTVFDFDSKLYTGLGIHYTSNRVNNPTIPTRGYIFELGADYRQSISDSKYNNITLSSNVSAYIPFSPTHKIVFATNIGGAYTTGDYEFFHANYLSNASRMRGFKTNRFAGDAIVYHASDLRLKLLQRQGGLKTGLGIFGSFDYGRAFLEGEDADDWHTSYGGGIYLTPLNMLGFKIGYYKGNEDSQLNIGGALSF